MKAKDKHQQRLRFVQALNRMDAAWMKFLQDKDVYDINYSDLYTGLWAKQELVRKQEALLFMRHLGPQTAKKYLDKAISIGLIIELPDPSDGRAKLIALSPELKIWLEEFFDHAVELFREALNE
ncbi:hypothetical protein SAMN05421690_100836 [Nitrosomonas sp. Nm51]|uniref:hypothetical protein n=1 Tax=Nitrosomonas sp. Nm51 TaxID=133720 RepID=UPI0008D0B39B|nr:hypothetical protein [Nitrosomonas sp. Nm51]SER09176.1 hypothetical protein SAMN05421690_100836 [Nitrosomonas sp. Nm51]